MRRLEMKYRSLQSVWGPCFIVLGTWLALHVASITNELRAQDFTQFRGPGGMGVVADASLPTSWSETENLAWKVEVPGTGWSQPVLWKDRLYLTTAVSDVDLRPKNFTGGVSMPQSMGLGGLSKPPDTTIQWQVHCYSTDSGDLIWSKTIVADKPKYPVHPSNTFATESPVVDEDGVYAFFGATGTVAGLNHDGEQLWKAELGAYPTSNGFGTGSSLAIDEGKVFVQHFTDKSGTLVCYRTKTGEEVWKTDREKFTSSWSSPLVWRNDQRAELISAGGELVVSNDPNTGQELWRVNNIKAPTACSIAADPKQIYFGGSDPFAVGAFFAVRAGGQGDLTPKSKNGQFETCSWLDKKGGPGMSSPVSNGDLVFVVDKSVLRCYDSTTGERLYQSRIPNLKMVAASPLIAGKQVLIVDEEGNGALVEANREFKVVGGGKIDDTFWATPALSKDSIYLRGVKALYCIRQAR